MKKIDTWVYDRNKRKINVPVHLVAADERGNKSKRTYFHVHLAEFDIEERSGNLDALRVRVFKRLDAKVELKWEPYLHLIVEGSAQLFREGKKKNEQITTDISVAACPVLLSKSATGEKLHTEHPEGVERWGVHKDRARWIHAGWPEVGRKKSRYNDGKVVVQALVLDTPEHRAALDLLSRDFQRLVDRLLALFEPGHATATLANASATRLLKGKDD